MERIIIIGNSGSGKTTFAKALAEKLNLPLVHLDKLYWCGEWEHISRDEFDRVLQNELEKPNWIIDGNFSRTLAHRFSYADAVFWFDLPTLTCLWGATSRVFKSYRKTRDDMGGNCPERFDKQKVSLYKSIFRFNRDNKKKIQKLLENSQDKNTVIFKNRKQAYKYLKGL